MQDKDFIHQDEKVEQFSVSIDQCNQLQDDGSNSDESSESFDFDLEEAKYFAVFDQDDDSIHEE